MPLSLHAALVFTGGEAEVVLPGGPLERDSLAMSSIGTIDAVRGFRVGAFVLGTCSAALEYRLMSETYADAEAKKAGIGAAARTILVVSGAKLCRQTSFVFARCEDLDHLVATDDAPADLIAVLSVMGVGVQVVGLAGGD